MIESKPNKEENNNLVSDIRLNEKEIDWLGGEEIKFVKFNPQRCLESQLKFPRELAKPGAGR
jgi:hypothetical protein